MEIYYRLGTAGEQELFGSETASFEGILVGAHIASLGRTWVTGLIVRTGKPYHVDPMTYVFAQDPQIVRRADEVRKSYDELADSYGGVIRQNAGRRPLRRSELRGNSVSDLASRVVDFEETVLSETGPVQATLVEYLEEIGETVHHVMPPSLVLPPYFYAESIEDPWYGVNLELAEATREVSDPGRVAPVLCISQRAAGTDSGLERMAQDYGEYPTVYVWISGLDEQRATQTALYGYGKLVHALARRGTHPRTLYGGPFSLALATAGLEGVSSGICYSEWKDVAVRATGGGFPTRYYVPLNRTKAVLANAARLLASVPECMCDCEVCRDVVPVSIRRRRPNPEVAEAIASLTQLETKRHLMRVRAGEVRKMRAHSAASIAARLEADARLARQRNTHVYGVPSSHLQSWAAVMHRLKL